MTDHEPAADETAALRARISALSAASLRISASLDLETVLNEVVESARALTGARYGAIATIDEAGAGPTRKASPAFCEWIRCIKGIAMASRASTTSMPWMKSPSGKWSAPQPRSVKPGWSRY